MAQGHPMSRKTRRRRSTRREQATSPRCKFAKLASETAAAITNPSATIPSIAELFEKVPLFEKSLQRPFQQIIFRRQQRAAVRLQSLARVRTILEVSAIQLLRGDWKKCPSVKCSTTSIFFRATRNIPNLEIACATSAKQPEQDRVHFGIPLTRGHRGSPLHAKL